MEAFSRLALLNELTKDHQNDPLALALASGKSAKAREPSKAAQRFTRQVNGKLVPFALNVEKRRLTWEVKPGEWSGVALAGTRGRELASWLEKAVSQAR